MSRAQSKPRKSGVRWPAEWEPQRGTWIGWPHNVADWPTKLPAIHWVYAEITRALLPGNHVNILVQNAAHEKIARTHLGAAGVDAKKASMSFHRIPTNRGWLRDSGAIFVKSRSGAASIAFFRFNAWAKYSNWRKDAKVVPYVAKATKTTPVPVRHADRHVVIEGGAIDGNGEGTLVTTEECLLDPRVQVRNPGFTREDYETVFREALGVTQTIWLGHGIAGDDTHGHVDDLCRFVAADTVVLVAESNPKDVNYRPLRENRERLQGVTLANGKRLRVVPLPMPSPLYFQGHRLPASYANFYIANETVLVPTFNDPRDREALGILADLFPGRTVVGIHAVDLVWGFGTLHCLTHEQPA